MSIVMHRTTPTLSAFLLFSPVSFLAFPISNAVTNHDESFLVLLIAGLFITILTFGVYGTLLKICEFIKVENQAMKVLQFSLILGITGATRGVFFFQAGEFLGLLQPSSFQARIASSTFTTFIWLGASIVLINTVRAFRSEYQGALNEYVASEITQATSSFVSEGDIEEVQEFQTELAASLIELMKDSKDSRLENLAEKITLHINEGLRPLSRRIWLRSLSEFPIISYKRLLREALLTLRFKPLNFILGIAFLALIENFFLRGLAESIIRVSSYVVLVMVVLVVFDKFRTRFTGTLFNGVFLLLIGLLPTLFSEAWVGLFGFERSIFESFFVMPVPGTLILALALAELAQQDRKFLLDWLRDNRHEALRDTARGVDAQKRQLASYLHNSFQSELLALSGQLTAAAMSRDKELTSKVLQKVASISSRSISEDLARFNDEPADRLRKVVESWANLVTITTNLPSELLSNRAKCAIVVQAIEEVASNSFRHGKADALHVSASRGEVGFKVIFRSNGTSPKRGKQGLGTAWFNQVSIKPWKIESNDGGTTIEIEV